VLLHSQSDTVEIHPLVLPYLFVMCNLRAVDWIFMRLDIKEFY